MNTSKLKDKEETTEIKNGSKNLKYLTKEDL